jgi:hypothetical protein
MHEAKRWFKELLNGEGGRNAMSIEETRKLTTRTRKDRGHGFVG